MTSCGGSVDVARAYHARTKHRFERYAAGPETLDWDSQPNPFREFAGAPRTVLALGAAALTVPFGKLGSDEPPASSPPTRQSLSHLLELSLGLSAWKEYGPDRWAVRCNPSSGNLHPTEAYVIARGIDGVADGLHHYLSRDHVLEQRHSVAPVQPSSGPALWLGLCSIHWREAWKYGERAFRYCQLDTGHALGALRYAAAILGWSARVVEGLTDDDLCALLGLDRAEDFAGAEREVPELLLHIDPSGPAAAGAGASPRPPQGTVAVWAGRANLLDPRPMYHWPVIDEVRRATRASAPLPAAPGTAAVARRPRAARPGTSPAAAVVLGRRSAQRFDPKQAMPAGVFLNLLDSLNAAWTLPWDVWNRTARVHPILFVHRVDGIAPGTYALPRSAHGEAILRSDLDASFVWKPVVAGTDVPLFLLAAGDVRNIASRLCCHQGIAGQSCFSLGMLADFGALDTDSPAAYRALLQEAGLIGQALYLEAEAAGLRGTGIGCFFDDPVHAALGLTSARLQSVYHFTVGYPLEDSRIVTCPAYPGRDHPAQE